MNLNKIIITSVSLLGILIIFTSLKMTTPDEEYLQNSKLIFKTVEIKNPIPLEMYENLEKYSEEYDIPKNVFYNIAFTETTYRGPFDWTYNPERTSCVGALGPMQIMPSTADLICNEKVSVKKLKSDIEFNISISAKLLRRLYDKYGDWEIVCGCYNTGKPIVNGYAKFCANNLNYQKNWVKP